jgi:hypothetical protein
MALHKIKQRLSTNFYSCLSPPLCQVVEHEPKRRVTFCESKVTPVEETSSQNKIADKWKRKLERRQRKGIMAITVETTIPQAE